MQEAEKMLKTLKSIDCTLKRIEQLLKTSKKREDTNSVISGALYNKKYKIDCGESPLSEHQEIVGG